VDGGKGQPNPLYNKGGTGQYKAHTGDCPPAHVNEGAGTPKVIPVRNGTKLESKEKKTKTRKPRGGDGKRSQGALQVQSSKKTIESLLS